jgi:hypothetical protein
MTGCSVGWHVGVADRARSRRVGIDHGTACRADTLQPASGVAGPVIVVRRRHSAGKRLAHHSFLSRE